MSIFKNWIIELEQFTDSEILKESMNRNLSPLRFFMKEELMDEIKRRGGAKGPEVVNPTYAWAANDLLTHLTVNGKYTICGLKTIDSSQTEDKEKRTFFCEACQK